jgi:hypothetical protein
VRCMRAQGICGGSFNSHKRPPCPPTDCDIHKEYTRRLQMTAQGCTLGCAVADVGRCMNTNVGPPSSGTDSLQRVYVWQ